MVIRTPVHPRGTTAVDAAPGARWRSPGPVPVLLGLAVLLGVAVPLGLAVATGGLSVPHNDAWSYSRIAEVFGRTGRIELLGWNRSALFGQFLPLGPLAGRIEVQHVFVALLGVVALVATYDLCARWTGRGRAALAAVVVAGWPGFGLLATSFMADVPTLAAVTACLALGQRAASRRSTWLLVLALAFGLWGCTIREQALAAPVAVLLVAGVAGWRSPRRRDRVAPTCAAAAFLVVLVAFELWRRSYHAEDPPVIAEASDMLGMGTAVAVRGFFLLALVSAPAVLLVARPWRWGRGTSLVVLATALVAAAAVHDFSAQGFFVGNYLDPVGPYWVAGNGRPEPIFGVHAWRLVVAVACGSGALLAGVLARRLPGVDRLLGSFLALVVLGNLATALSGQGLYDRYWLPALPPLLAVVLSERPGPARLGARASAAAACALLAAVSATITTAGLAYDTARWRAAEQLVSEGVPARDVDAGLEWSGYHSVAGMSPAGSGVLPGSRSCFVITAEPRADRAAVRVVAYRTFVVAGTSRLWVYDVPGCPPNTTW